MSSLAVRFDLDEQSMISEPIVTNVGYAMSASKDYILFPSGLLNFFRIFMCPIRTGRLSSLVPTLVRDGVRLVGCFAFHLAGGDSFVDSDEELASPVQVGGSGTAGEQTGRWYDEPDKNALSLNSGGFRCSFGVANCLSIALHNAAGRCEGC